MPTTHRTILKARQIDVTDAAVEVWGYANPDLECVPFIGRVMARHVDYVVGDDFEVYELWARASECCDAATEKYTTAGGCWPAPGLGEKMVGHVFNHGNCISAQCKQFALGWDGAAWTGSFGLRNGTINVSVVCDPLKGLTEDGKFQITLSGACLGAPQTHNSASYCEDPISFTIAQAVASTCCGCNACPPEGEGSAISLLFTVNCKPYKVARLIDVDAVSGVETWGYAEGCNVLGTDVCYPTCQNIHCTLVMELSAGGDCDQYNGTYSFCYQASPLIQHWLLDVPGAGGILTLRMYCPDYQTGVEGSLRLEARCDLQSVDAFASTDDPENLDVTFGFAFTAQPPDCCNGGFTVRVRR